MPAPKGTPAIAVRFSQKEDLRPDIEAACAQVEAETGGKPSVNAWVITAIKEKLKRDGVKRPRINAYALKMQYEVIRVNGCNTIINPHLLEEPTDSQRFKSVQGQRTAFLDFHVYMFSLTDEQLDILSSAYKDFFKSELVEDENYYVDTSLLKDSIDYQLALRDADPFNAFEVTKDITKSWREHQRLAEDYEEITSAHLIGMAKKLVEH